MFSRAYLKRLALGLHHCSRENRTAIGFLFDHDATAPWASQVGGKLEMKDTGSGWGHKAEWSNGGGTQATVAVLLASKTRTPGEGGERSSKRNPFNV